MKLANYAQTPRYRQDIRAQQKQVMLDFMTQLNQRRIDKSRVKDKVILKYRLCNPQQWYDRSNKALRKKCNQNINRKEKLFWILFSERWNSPDTLPILDNIQSWCLKHKMSCRAGLGSVSPYKVTTKKGIAEFTALIHKQAGQLNAINNITMQNAIEILQPGSEVIDDLPFYTYQQLMSLSIVNQHIKPDIVRSAYIGNGIAGAIFYLFGIPNEYKKLTQQQLRSGGGDEIWIWLRQHLKIAHQVIRRKGIELCGSWDTDDTEFFLCEFRKYLGHILSIRKLPQYKPFKTKNRKMKVKKN